MKKFMFAMLMCLTMAFASCGYQTKGSDSMCDSDTIVCGIDSTMADSLIADSTTYVVK